MLNIEREERKERKERETINNNKREEQKETERNIETRKKYREISGFFKRIGLCLDFFKGSAVGWPITHLSL